MSEIYVHQSRKVMTNAGGPIYGLAFLGALIYYLQHADTFWEGILGFLKAIVWPAFLIYHLCDFLKM